MLKQYCATQASGNKITSLLDLEPQLANKKSLETVYLEQNPVQQTEGSAYRRKIILALPQLKQIDATWAALPESMQTRC